MYVGAVARPQTHKTSCHFNYITYFMRALRNHGRLYSLFMFVNLLGSSCIRSESCSWSATNIFCLCECDRWAHNKDPFFILKRLNFTGIRTGSYQENITKWYLFHFSLIFIHFSYKSSTWKRQPDVWQVKAPSFFVDLDNSPQKCQ